MAKDLVGADQDRLEIFWFGSAARNARPERFHDLLAARRQLLAQAINWLIDQPV